MRPLVRFIGDRPLARPFAAGLAILLAAMIFAAGRPAGARDGGTPAAVPSPATAVVYMSITNGGGGPDRLLGGETRAAATVELHQTLDENGVMRMQPRPEGIEIPAGGETRFDAGGNHVMLVGLTADLIPGGSYDLTLRFETAGEIVVPVQVRFDAEPDEDTPPPGPVTVGDLTLGDAWSRPAPALLGIASVGITGPAPLDTPVVAGDLTLVLTADGPNAGPRALTAILTDGTGEPVTDATVSLSLRSLEMDHGVSTRETEMVEPGRYLAERVPMGMGGDWRVEITVTRPGVDPVVVPFVLTLDGPSH